MKVLFFGTPHFAARVLEELVLNGIEVVAVITKPSRPKGRSPLPIPPEVKVVAEKMGIPVHQPEKVSDPSFLPILQAYHADLFAVVAYGEILKQHVLDLPKKGCINLHASLLPFYRGAAPIQRAIMAGETVSGVTIMHMAKQMDAGDVIEKVSVPITQDMTYGQLEAALLEVGCKAFLKVLKNFKEDLPHRYPQDHSLATFAPKVELEECEVKWDLPASQIHNLIRGASPEPGAWCWGYVHGVKKRLKIFKSHLLTNDTSLKPGSLVEVTPQGMAIACLKGVILLTEMQWEGKKKLPVAEFCRGIHPSSVTFNL